MIIGIAGKKQTGKDTVAKIIQYLTTKVKHSYEFEDFINPKVNYPIGNPDDIMFKNMGSDWEIRKFADKLKDIVCLLTGCTREELEDENFKTKSLPKEWKHDFGDMTYRFALQHIGTELFRRKFHPNTWVNATMSDYKDGYHIGDGKYVTKDVFINNQACINTCNHLNISMDELLANNVGSNWIISDVRFPNEVKAIKNKDGIVIKVQRKLYHWKRKDGSHFYTTTPFVEHEKGLQSIKDVHDSETALNDFDGYDYIINNNGSIKQLIYKVKKILIIENIL